MPREKEVKGEERAEWTVCGCGSPYFSPTLVSMGAVDRWADSLQWRICNSWTHGGDDDDESLVACRPEIADGKRQVSNINECPCDCLVRMPNTDMTLPLL